MWFNVSRDIASLFSSCLTFLQQFKWLTSGSLLFSTWSLPSMILLDQGHLSFLVLCLFCWFLFLWILPSSLWLLYFAWVGFVCSQGSVTSGRPLAAGLVSPAQLDSLNLQPYTSSCLLDGSTRTPFCALKCNYPKGNLLPPLLQSPDFPVFSVSKIWLLSFS